MWGLDRFSANSTPAPSSPGRNSPAPRRSLQVQRPGVAPRSSSLSLLSNSSSSNINSNTRNLVTSGLKNQIYSAPPEDVEDPVLAFEQVITSTLSKIQVIDDKDTPTDEIEKPSEFARDIDFGSLSLHHFVDEANRQTLSPTNGCGQDQFSYSNKSVEECMFINIKCSASLNSMCVLMFYLVVEQEKQRLDDLHESIQECDAVLESVERYLTNFQADLSKVSAEIETLQTRSATLNSKLESRREVEKLVGPYVEQIALSPAVVRKISEGTIDDAWIKALDDLQARVKGLESNRHNIQNSKAVNDLRPLFEDLSKRAMQRIRDHFASKIRAMRSPNINAQVIQHNDFTRYKTLFSFLSKREPQLAEEILQAYVNTMRWYYATHFGRYREALSKLRVYTTDKTDVLGEEPAARVGVQTKITSSSPMPTPDPFNLTRRIDILRNPTVTALPASTAEDTKIPAHLEIPFLHYNLALLDNATSEYTFLSTFLPSPPAGPFNAPKISRALTAIFTPAFEIGSTMTKSLTSECFDALGILLTIRLTQHFAFTLQRRRIPTLETYVNGMAMMLWPRFQQVLDAHLDSLKRATSSVPARQSNSAGGAASAAFASLAGGSASNASAAASTVPHTITQRFANLLRGILALSSEARDDEPVGSSVARLREGFETWVSKMAQSFGAGDKGRRAREQFMQSNYGLVLAVLSGDDVKGKLADECRAHFEGSRGVVGA